MLVSSLTSKTPSRLISTWTYSRETSFSCISSESDDGAKNGLAWLLREFESLLSLVNYSKPKLGTSPLRGDCWSFTSSIGCANECINSILLLFSSLSSITDWKLLKFLTSRECIPKSNLLPVSRLNSGDLTLLWNVWFEISWAKLLRHRGHYGLLLSSSLPHLTWKKCLSSQVNITICSTSLKIWRQTVQSELIFYRPSFSY